MSVEGKHQASKKYLFRSGTLSLPEAETHPFLSSTSSWILLYDTRQLYIPLLLAIGRWTTGRNNEDDLPIRSARA